MSESEEIQEVVTLEKSITDFTNDLITVFPEYEPTIRKWWKLNANEEKKEKSLLFIKRYCIRVYLPLLTDILMENNKIFDGEEPLELLPQICFRKCWKCQLSETTRINLWKHIKLITLLSFKESESMKMNDMFENEKKEETKEENEMNLNKLKNQLNGTHLGELTQELIKNVFGEQGINTSSLKDMLNPDKMQKLIKSSTSLIEQKVENGELKTDELMNDMQNIMKSYDLNNHPLIKNNPMFSKIFENLSSQFDKTDGPIEEFDLQSVFNQMFKK